jgi:hypothetical protein
MVYFWLKVLFFMSCEMSCLLWVKRVGTWEEMKSTRRLPWDLFLN